MLYKRKMDRVVDVEKSEENFRKALEKEPLEKGDLKAMMIAALCVFVPVFILVAGLMVGFSYFFMIR